MLTLDHSEKITALLTKALEPKTAKEATDQIEKLAKKPSFVLSLVSHACYHNDEYIRQLAGVLLKRFLKKTWNQINTETKRQTQEILLQRCLEDPSAQVQLTLSHVIGTVCRLTAKEWHESLFSFLATQLKEFSSITTKTACIYILVSITESIQFEHPEILDRYFDFAYESFLLGLQLEDTRPNTPCSLPVSSLKGLEALFLFVEDNKSRSHPFLQKLCTVLMTSLQQSVVHSRFDITELALEFLNDIAEFSWSLDAIASFIPDIVKLLVTLVSDAIIRSLHIANALRKQAVCFIDNASRHKPNIFVKTSLLDDIVTAVVPLACDERWKHVGTTTANPHVSDEQDKSSVSTTCNDFNDDYDDDDFNDDGEKALDADLPIACRFASQCLDALALNIPERAVFVKVYQTLTPYLQSTCTYQCRGAILLLGVLSEGCESILRKNLSVIVPAVLEAFSSTDTDLVSAAAIAWGEMSQYLQPEILKYYTVALNICVKLLQESLQVNVKVFGKICSGKTHSKIITLLIVFLATKLFCDNLTPQQIHPYVSSLVPLMLHALVYTSKDINVQKNCIECVGSIARASEKHVMSFFFVVDFLLFFFGISQDISVCINLIVYQICWFCNGNVKTIS